MLKEFKDVMAVFYSAGELRSQDEIRAAAQLKGWDEKQVELMQRLSQFVLSCPHVGLEARLYMQNRYMSISDVSYSLNMNVNTVKTNIFRSGVKLKELFGRDILSDIYMHRELEQVTRILDEVERQHMNGIKEFNELMYVPIGQGVYVKEISDDDFLDNEGHIYRLSCRFIQLMNEQLDSNVRGYIYHLVLNKELSNRDQERRERLYKAIRG